MKGEKLDVSQRDVLQDDLDSTLLSLSALTDLATQGIADAQELLFGIAESFGQSLCDAVSGVALSAG